MAEIGVRFYMAAQIDKRATQEKGRPIYRDVEMVEVLIPGDRNFRPAFPAHELMEQPKEVGDEGRTWAEVYADAYRDFRAGADQSVSGTPLGEAPFLTRARVSELTALGIQTVEQLAELADRAKKRLGPDAGPLVAQAKAYLDAARQSADPVRLASENASLQERIEAMAREMEAMRASTRKGEARA